MNVSSRRGRQCQVVMCEEQENTWRKLEMCQTRTHPGVRVPPAHPQGHCWNRRRDFNCAQQRAEEEEEEEEKQLRKRFNVRNWMSEREKENWQAKEGRERLSRWRRETVFLFVSPPGGSPFISLPLTLRSESGFPGDVSTSCFSPTHLAVSPRRCWKPALFASPWAECEWEDVSSLLVLPLIISFPVSLHRLLGLFLFSADCSPWLEADLQHQAHSLSITPPFSFLSLVDVESETDFLKSPKLVLESGVCCPARQSEKQTFLHTAMTTSPF